MAVVRNLIIRVGADISDLEKNFNKMQKQITKVSREFNNAGTTLLQGVTLPLGAVAAAGIKAASDLQEVQNVVDVAFGESAKAVNEWSKTTLKAYGLTELQAKQYAGTMRAIAASQGIAGKAADDMSMNLAQLAGDIASFYNLPLEEAFMKIQSGMTGETMPLKQIGINMNIVNLEAYAMAKGIKKSYEEMSLAEQTQIRYNYLMETTKNAQGDFARTSNSFANTMRVLQGQFMAVAGELMAGLLPTLTGLLNKVKEGVTWFSSLDQQTKNNIASTLLWAAAIGPVLIGVSKMISVFNVLVGGVKNLTIAYNAMNAAFLLNPAIALTAAMGVLTVALVQTYLKTETATDKINNLTESSRKLREQVNNNIAATDKSTSSEMANVAIAERLTDRLNELANNTKKTTAEKTEMKGIVDKLNSAIPNLALAINAETGELNKQLPTIQAAINKYKELLFVKAAEKKSQKAAEDLLDIQTQKDNLGKAYDDAQKALKDKQERAAKIGIKPGSYEMQGETRGEIQNIENIRNEIGALTDTQINLENVMQSSFDKAAEYTKKYGETVTSTANVVSTGIDTIKGSGSGSGKDKSEKEKTPFEKMVDNLDIVKTKVQNTVSTIGNAFELMAIKQGISSTSTEYLTGKIRNLKEQGEALTPSINEVQKAYEYAAATFGATSNEAVELQSQLTALQLEQAKYTKEIHNTADALLKQAAAQQTLQKLLNPSVKSNFAQNFQSALSSLQSLKDFGYNSKQIYDLAVKNATTQTVAGAEDYSKGGGKLAGDIIIQSVAQTPADIATAVKRGLQQAAFGL